MTEQTPDPVNPLVPPPVVVAVVGVIMWTVDRNLELGKFKSALPGPIAGVLLIAGLLLMFAAVASFVAANTTINPLRPSPVHSASRAIRSISLIC